MPLLMSFRRWWCVVFLALLSLPTIGLFTKDVSAPVRMTIAAPVGWWIRAAEHLDPFINDNYGMRGAFMSAHAAYRRFLKTTPNRPVLVGKNERLFFTAEQTLDQSLGRVFRKARLERLVEMTTRMREALAAKGAQLVVMVPPNGQTVYADQLPDWAIREQRHPTEYDFLAKALPEAGTKFVDLRAPLEAARADGEVYFRTDTHWNQRGALIGFNAAMAAAGREDLAVSPADALGPLQERPIGDLSRLMGETSPKGDFNYEQKGPAIKPADLKPILGVMPPSPPKDPFEPYAYETGHAGPRILVIGDSFTQYFWPGLLASRSSAFGWMHHRNCTFDWTAVERFKPDLVIYAPVERSMLCNGWPAGLPAPAGRPS